MKALPWRGDVAADEEFVTENPIFLVQARQLELNARGLPEGVGIDADGGLVTIVGRAVTGIHMSWVLDHHPTHVRVYWQTLRVCFSREEGEAWADDNTHDLGDIPRKELRVECAEAVGDLAELLRARSLAPTGDLTRKPRRALYIGTPPHESDL